jgi:outer membrane protein assembly factor BamB
MYAPNTFGCAPTSSIVRDIASLPLSAIRALKLWDAGLGPGIYITGEDKHVYQLDATGRPLWNTELQAEGLTLATANFGIADKQLLVGEGKGQLTSLDPATGIKAWRAIIPRAAWSTSKVPNGVNSIDVDEAAGRIVASTTQGRLELLDETGAHVQGADAVFNDAFTQVAFAPDGRIYAMNANSLYQYDSELTPQGNIRPTGTIGFAIAPIGIILNHGRQTHIYDPDAFSAVSVAPNPIVGAAPAVLTTAGDATGDGVIDLILALENLDLVVIDGATGQVAWTYTPTPGAPGGVFTLEKLVTGSEDDVCGVVVNNDPTTQYNSPAQCVQALGTATNKPLALYAAGGKVAYARKENGQTRLSVVAGESPDWTVTLPVGTMPLATTIGPWLFNGGVLTGTQNGTLILHDRLTSVPLLDTTVTSFVGKFAYQFRIPPGALFGTHLIVGTLTWKDGVGQPHEARLFDTFEVVGKDGKPADLPSYLISFLLEQRDDPLRKPGG